MLLAEVGWLKHTPSQIAVALRISNVILSVENRYATVRVIFCVMCMFQQNKVSTISYFLLTFFTLSLKIICDSFTFLVIYVSEI